MPDPNADVIIIGAGMAGLIAANRLAQLGVSSLVLEKGTDAAYCCNSRITGGAFHVCYRDVTTDPAVLEKAIVAVNHGIGHPELPATVARNAKRTVDFLGAEGMRFVKAGLQEYQNRVLAPPRPNFPGLHWEGRGGDVMLRTLEANLRKRGGSLRRGTRATALRRTAAGWAVDVATANGCETLGAPAVVIADGGFQADLDLLRRYVTRHPERLLQRGASTGSGDGIRMAEAQGAALVDMANFYGHPVCRDAFANPQLSPYPFLDSLVTAGIVVGADGTRFADEGQGAVYVTNMIARLPDPLSAFVVFDEAIWSGPGTHGAIPPNPHVPRVGGRVETSATLEGLAAKMAVPAAALAATIDGYNRAVAAKDDAGLAPPRRRDKHAPLAIATPPFHAIRLCAGITYTMGGIAIDGSGRVLRADGSVIEDLYAAGTVAGGVEGGPNSGYVGGLVTSGAMALAVAEHIAGNCANPTEGL